MQEPLTQGEDVSRGPEEIDEAAVVNKIIAFLAEGGDGQITLDVRDGAIMRAKFDRFVYEDADAEESADGDRE